MDEGRAHGLPPLTEVLGEEESVYFRDVVPNRLVMLQCMAPYPLVYGLY